MGSPRRIRFRQGQGRSAARGRAHRLAPRLTPAGPVFEPLRPALERLPAGRWPTHDELTAAAAGIETARGRPLRFVAPREHTDRERRCYELHIAGTGEVETRPENWHDLFNALVWLAFPRAKAAINAQHAALLEERGEAEARHRGPERDALTLFDEGGVVVATSSARVRELIEAFEWKALFWHEREHLRATTRFLAFGHALYEQALAPYAGMVAKTVFVPEAGDVDAALAAHFADRSHFRSPRQMAPMPVLGIPGWHEGTFTESWYDDAKHFRSKGPRPPK